MTPHHLGSIYENRALGDFRTSAKGLKGEKRDYTPIQQHSLVGSAISEKAGHSG